MLQTPCLCPSRLNQPSHHQRFPQPLASSAEPRARPRRRSPIFRAHEPWKRTAAEVESRRMPRATRLAALARLAPATLARSVQNYARRSCRSPSKPAEVLTVGRSRESDSAGARAALSDTWKIGAPSNQPKDGGAGRPRAGGRRRARRVRRSDRMASDCTATSRRPTLRALRLRTSAVYSRGPSSRRRRQEASPPPRAAGRSNGGLRRRGQSCRAAA